MKAQLGNHRNTANKLIGFHAENMRCLPKILFFPLYISYSEGKSFVQHSGFFTSSLPIARRSESARNIFSFIVFSQISRRIVEYF